MADISKIRLENETYNIKDETARNEINNIIGQDTIFLGDSYAAGTTFEHGEVEYLTSWCEYLRRLMGLTSGHYYIFAQGNAGFAKIGNNSMNFQMTLASRINEITDQNAIKNIIVCGGYNDWNETASLIKQRISEFISYCKQQFPNAQVYIGMIGGNSANTSQGASVRDNLFQKVLNIYSKCNNYGGIYLSGVEQATHNFFIFNEQGNHPNESGYKYIANMIYNSFKNGYSEVFEGIRGINLPSVLGTNKTLNFQTTIQNGIKTIYMDNFFVDNLSLSTQGTDNVQIVSANTLNNCFKPNISNKSIQMRVDLFIRDTSNVQYSVPRINRSKCRWINKSFFYIFSYC